MAGACAQASLAHSIPSSSFGVYRVTISTPCSVRFRCSQSNEQVGFTAHLNQFKLLGCMNVKIPECEDTRGLCHRCKVVKTIQGSHEDKLPTQEDIMAAAKENGILLDLKPTGPLFTLTAVDAATGTKLGTADGFIKPWLTGPILHLDSIRLTKASATRSGRSIFGAAVYMGALMVRHGIDRGCDKGELLAINDSEEYHRKLVRYYSRLGWRPVYVVKGGSVRDVMHMLVWGGVGTRMDAELRELLGKWASTMKPASQAMVES